MKRFLLVIGLFALFAGWVWAAEEYPLGPDSQRQPGVPQGTVAKYTWTSRIYPGTVRDYWVYVPAQYVANKPACVMLFEDGGGTLNDGRLRVPIVFDNLIAKHDMPVTIAIMINPGVLKALHPSQADVSNRSYEYDDLSDRYARFLLDEILPEVGKHYNLSSDPNDRAISGGSSGGICSFTVAWTHPEAFRRVLSFIGSFANHRGGDIYPALIRKTEPKPLRVLLQDGDHDLNIFAGDWWLSNQAMASALAYAGYDCKFVTGDKDHDMIQGGAIFPDALRWLWRDYPQPIAKAKMRPLGDQRSGFVEFDPDWERESSQSHAATNDALPFLSSPFDWYPPSRVKRAAGIAVDQQGNFYTSDPSGKAIYRITVTGQVSTLVKNAAGVGGLAFGPDGQLYGCDSKGIERYTPDGRKILRFRAVPCTDLAFTRSGGIYFTSPMTAVPGYLPPGFPHDLGHPPRSPIEDFYHSNSNGICLSPDQSMVYVSDPTGRWVWSYQVQADGSLANGEPFYRMEIPDESSQSGASGIAMDDRENLYVATLMGIQICGPGGQVTNILNRPEQAGPELGPITGVAFAGTDHQYLYIVVGNDVFRRHMVRRGGS
jgi:enterochelin esterase-like enzyme/sugar lactone lactonase YvrE